MTSPENRLTALQERALKWLLRDEEVNEHFFYDYGGGLHGFRTFRSLAKRGLLEKVRWEEYSSDERGYVWRLSHDGYKLARELFGGPDD
jgi:hypothetical protein